MAVALTDTDEYKKGHPFEVLVADKLRETGCFVIPSYDYTGTDGNKAPKLVGTHVSHVLPDLDVSRDGMRIWVEAKAKDAPSWTYVTQRLEHGIPLRHWNDYQKVQEITGCKVWIVIGELKAGEALRISLDDLRKYEPLRTTDMVKNGENQGGMVYFARDWLTPWFAFEQFNNKLVINKTYEEFERNG